MGHCTRCLDIGTSTLY